MSIRRRKPELTHCQRKKLQEECWDIDSAFFKWINIHLKQYLKDADKIVDLEYYTFEYKDSQITQKEAIEKMIYLSDKLIIGDWWDGNEYKIIYDNFMDLFNKVLPVLWW